MVAEIADHSILANEDVERSASPVMAFPWSGV
jgi:hypothetical protein